MIWNNRQLNKSLNTAASYADSDTANSNLVRLVEDPSIKKDIQFDELSTAYVEGTPDSMGAEQQVKVLGLEYPMIRINDTVLNKTEIVSMSVSSRGFVPTISLSLEFNTTYFLNRSMPKDGDMISIFMRTDTAALQYLRNDFIVTSCKSSVQGSSAKNYVTLTGKLFIPGFDSQNNDFAIIGTSKDAIKDIARFFRLGFATNDAENTSDFQNWICCNSNVEQYVNEITEHSWKNEMSFYKTWVDLYYNLCYVNVNKFLLSAQNTEDEVDLIYNSHTLNVNSMSGQDQTAEGAGYALKLFSNSYDFKGSPFFIKSWNPVNNSSKISFNEGYDLQTYTFVHNQNLYATNDSSCFEILSNVPAYDPDKTDSYILLRGRARYSKEDNPETEQARINYNFTDTYVRHNWTGIEYAIDSDERDKTSTNGWSGNVHLNFGRAEFHNLINIRELDKLYIVITCDGLCLQVMRGERIPVYLVYNTQLDSVTSNKLNNDPQPNEVNRFYSGYYIVDSISYEYNRTSTSMYSPFSTTMVLKRREWPAPEQTMKAK